MKPLTIRQAQILEFIRHTLEAEGAPPTLAEIARAMGVASTHGIRGHLQALERKGAIELVAGAARGIRLTEDAQLGLPIIGRVAAGQPIVAEEHIESRCKLGPELFQHKADYLLRVQGMSMRDAGILDGDLLAVRRTPEAYPGQIVVARIDGEVTVKRLRVEGTTAWLEPANPDFLPITVDLTRQELAIEGLVVGVIRTQVL